VLRVYEIFASIEGEGVDIGMPSVFVRLSGCNLRCRWCDTPEALDLYSGSEMSIDNVLEEVKKYGIRRVVVTGGEPLMQNDALELVKKLLSEGFFVSVETNGTYDISALTEFNNVRISIDIKTPSSGMEGRTLWENLSLLRPHDQVKFVLEGTEDYNYALSVIRRFEPKCNVVLMPVGGINAKWIAERVLKDKLSCRVLVQLHKIICIK